MAFVIDKKNGERKRVPIDDLDAVIRAGLFAVDPAQTVTMEDGEGNIVDVSAAEYAKRLDEGARTLTESEFYNLIENRRKESKYTRPCQKSPAIAQGAMRGIDLEVSEVLRGLAGDR